MPLPKIKLINNEEIYVTISTTIIKKFGIQYQKYTL